MKCKILKYIARIFSLYFLIYGIFAYSYERIITFGPNLTEIVYALGAGNKLVGCDIYSNYPPEVRKIQKCGGILNPDIERIIKLQPQIIIIQGTNEKLKSFCKKYNIKYYETHIETIEDLKKTILDLAKLLNCVENGKKLIQTLNFHRVKLKKNKKVLFVFAKYNNNIMTVNNDTFLGEIIELAGGINIFGNSKIKYPQVSIEEIIRKNPEIIIEVLPGKKLSRKEMEKHISFWKKYKTIKAVKNNKIYILTDDYLLIPGPRIVKIYERLKEIIEK